MAKQTKSNQSRMPIGSPIFYLILSYIPCSGYFITENDDIVFFTSALLWLAGIASLIIRWKEISRDYVVISILLIISLFFIISPIFFYPEN